MGSNDCLKGRKLSKILVDSIAQGLICKTAHMFYQFLINIIWMWFITLYMCYCLSLSVVPLSKLLHSLLPFLFLPFAYQIALHISLFTACAHRQQSACLCWSCALPYIEWQWWNFKVTQGERACCYWRKEGIKHLHLKKNILQMYSAPNNDKCYHRNYTLQCYNLNVTHFLILDVMYSTHLQSSVLN